MSNDKPKFRAPQLQQQPMYTHSTTTKDGQYSFEYELVGYAVQPLEPMLKRIQDEIVKMSERGFRYVESIRLNTTEGILVFERKR